MVKFIGESKEGRMMLGLGLSRENIQRLLKGEPIHIHREELDHISPMEIDEILIFAGETEEVIQEDFIKAGFLVTSQIVKRGSRH